MDNEQFAPASAASVLATASARSAPSEPSVAHMTFLNMTSTSFFVGLLWSGHLGRIRASSRAALRDLAPFVDRSGRFHAQEVPTSGVPVGPGLQ